MSVNQEFEETGSITSLCAEYLKNNFIDPEECERLGAVSYTHLDVYKRQRSPRLMAWMTWKIWLLSAMAPKGQFTRHMPQDTHLS